MKWHIPFMLVAFLILLPAGLGYDSQFYVGQTGDDQLLVSHLADIENSFWGEIPSSAAAETPSSSAADTHAQAAKDAILGGLGTIASFLVIVFLSILGMMTVTVLKDGNVEILTNRGFWIGLLVIVVTIIIVIVFITTIPVSLG